MDNHKPKLTPNEISHLRGAVGTVAWKSSQTGPHFQAEAGLLLSEILYATNATVHKANKLIREVKREASQCLRFPCWNCRWNQMVIVTWCDAGQSTRADKSSTLGYITGICPRSLLDGEEQIVAVLNWKSSKTPRQCLGSNGAEVQAITEGEDSTFKVRVMWVELHGVKLKRSTTYQQIKENVEGALVMDSRGIYDAMEKRDSTPWLEIEQSRL